MGARHVRLMARQEGAAANRPWPDAIQPATDLAAGRRMLRYAIYSEARRRASRSRASQGGQRHKKQHLMS